jgi:hypothetical protein
MNLTPWKWRKEEREPLQTPPFRLEDHDGPSRLWLIAYMLDDLHDLPHQAASLRDLATKWAKERTKE